MCSTDPRKNPIMNTLFEAGLSAGWTMSSIGAKTYGKPRYSL